MPNPQLRQIHLSSVILEHNRPPCSKMPVHRTSGRLGRSWNMHDSACAGSSGVLSGMAQGLVLPVLVMELEWSVLCTHNFLLQFWKYQPHLLLCYSKHQSSPKPFSACSSLTLQMHRLKNLLVMRSVWQWLSVMFINETKLEIKHLNCWSKYAGKMIWN